MRSEKKCACVGAVRCCLRTILSSAKQSPDTSPFKCLCLLCFPYVLLLYWRLPCIFTVMCFHLIAFRFVKTIFFVLVLSSSGCMPLHSPLSFRSEVLRTMHVPSLCHAPPALHLLFSFPVVLACGVSVFTCLTSSAALVLVKNRSPTPGPRRTEPLGLRFGNGGPRRNGRSR